MWHSTLLAVELTHRHFPTNNTLLLVKLELQDTYHHRPSIGHPPLRVVRLQSSLSSLCWPITYSYVYFFRCLLSPHPVIRSHHTHTHTHTHDFLVSVPCGVALKLAPDTSDVSLADPRRFRKFQQAESNEQPADNEGEKNKSAWWQQQQQQQQLRRIQWKRQASLLFLLPSCNCSKSLLRFGYLSCQGVCLAIVVVTSIVFVIFLLHGPTSPRKKCIRYGGGR